MASESKDIPKLISTLTLEQKCALLTGDKAFATLALPRHNIDAIVFSDGPHGLRKQTEGANHLGIGQSLPATCFPTAVTLANSWDPELCEQVGQALGQEAKAQGVNVLLGPGVCMKRSPLCGRNFEYFSEDPYVAGKLAAAYVRGVESEGVASSPKHFAVNSQETRRQASDSIVDERTLRELYLRAFELIVREGKPSTIMSSYNKINGTYANEHQHLLQRILRDEWGFTGAVVTDWGGSNDHVAGVAAGSTFEMPACGYDSVRELVLAVRAGKLSEELLDARVAEAIALAQHTHTDTHPAFDQVAHHALARRAAASGMVLLKNDQILPLKPHTRVALIGDFARTPRYQGAGSSLVNAVQLDTVLSEVGNTDFEFMGFEPAYERDGKENPQLIEAACALAAKADVLVYCFGLTEAAESEGLDRTHLKLDAPQITALNAIAQVNPHIIAVLSAGSVVETSWLASCQALLYTGLSGQASGSATWQLLSGAKNPSGHLAETWPKRLADTPCADTFPSDEPQALYTEGLFMGYRYYISAQVPVAFPFGFGLSYSTFELADATYDAHTNSVTVRISNTSSVDGAQVVQVYVAKLDAKVIRPARELKGFAKVNVPAGQSVLAHIQLDDKSLSYFNVSTGKWEVEGGSYQLLVGTSCIDTPIKLDIEAEPTPAPNPYEGLKLPHYQTGDIRAVSREEFEVLLGHTVQEEPVVLDRNLTFRDMGHTRSPLLWLVAAVLSRLVHKTDAHGRPNLNALFIYNMPLRALQKNAGQFISMGFVDALVREAKGWGVCGVLPAALVQYVWHWGFVAVWVLWTVLPLLYEFVKNLLVGAWYARRVHE